MLVVRAQGVQSEAEVAFGGLLEVARPLLARLDELPGGRRARSGRRSRSTPARAWTA